MKYISRILFTMGLAFSLTACTEDALETTIPELPAKGDISVNITFAMPDAEAQTRSKVSGEEKRVHTMQMVCFDANGLYLGIRNAEITPDETVDKGTIKGTVPQGTSRIHFIANRKLTIPLSFNVGETEENVMHSPELSTIWNDANHQEVCYWGYHKETSATLMEGWLKPEGQDAKNTVYLIRDRAKIVLDYDPDGAEYTVEKIEWLIHNGNERGYLAPSSVDWSNDGYWKVGKGNTNTKVADVDLNEYTDSRYSIIDDDGNFDLAYQSTGTDTPKAQFLFDDDNTDINILKVILKVKYANLERPRYHVLRVKRDKTNDQGEKIIDPITGEVQSELVKIIRNQTYNVEISNLSPYVAYYTTLKDAIDGTEFVNSDPEIDRSITYINNTQYSLQILLPTETNSIVFNSVGEQQPMDFAFRSVSNPSQSGADGDDLSDFDIHWENTKQEICENNLGLSYDSTTKQFKITATVKEGQVSDDLKDEWIVVEHTPSGLKRYIHVYVINQFQFFGTGGQPTLVQDGNDFVLSFTIPPLEVDPNDQNNPNKLMYPVGLYPIDVKFTTNTLNAYGVKKGEKDYGLFGVGVEPTLKDKGDLKYDLTKEANFENYNAITNPKSSTNTNDILHWYYQQADKPWDYWYTYSVKSYPTDGKVKIYFEDVRSHIHYDDQGNTQNRIKEVGLFMSIKYFGKIYSFQVTGLN